MKTISTQHGISRRDFLRIAGVTSLAGLAVSCTAAAPEPPAPSSSEPGAAGSGLQGTLEVMGPYLPIVTADFPEGLTVGEELRQEYMSMHPGVNIEWNPMPIPEGVPNDFAWRREQMNANAAPHVTVEGLQNINIWSGQGLWVALDDYLAQPNPYAEGEPTWSDMLLDDVLLRSKGPDGRYYFYPYNSVGGQILYYNQDIFNEYGLQPPTTVQEWFNVMETIRSDGKYVPHETWVATWPFDIWSDTLCTKRFLEEVDQDGDGWYSTQEWTRVIKQGKFSAYRLPVWKAMQMWKWFVPYWQQDWPTLAATCCFAAEGRKLFLAGRSAIVMGGADVRVELEKDEFRTFEVGYFPWPQLTVETVPEWPSEEEMVWISGKRSEVNGMAVTQRAVADGVLDLAVDFIRFWTAPQNLKRLIDEAAQQYEGFFFVPTQKAMSVVNMPETVMEGNIRRMNPDFWGVRYFYDHFELAGKYFAGLVSEEEMVAAEQAALTAAADAAIEEFGWQDLAAQWESEPQVDPSEYWYGLEDYPAGKMGEPPNDFLKSWLESN